MSVLTNNNTFLNILL